MADGTRSGGGFRVLDGAGLVAGAAVALVHLRGAGDPAGLGPGSTLLWGTFAWVALTAAGPFVLLTRRLGPAAMPARVGDWLWGMLGTPWLLTALIRTAAGDPVEGPRKDVLYASALGSGIVVAAVVALAVTWATWVMVAPEAAARTAGGPWTNRLGLLLAIAWPLQCGAGLVVIG